MKKLIAIILGISMAALVGGVSLAGEKDDSKTDDDTPAPSKNYDSAKSNTSKTDDDTPAPAKNYDSTKSNTSTDVATDGDGGE